MRVLFLSPCAQLGGAERVLLDSLISLSAVEPRWPLHVILGEQGPLESELRRAGITCETAPFPESLALAGSTGAPCLLAIPGAVSYIRNLNRRIRAFAPHLIHSNGFKMHVLAACQAAVPVVWHLHDYPSSRIMRAAALRASAHRVSGAIAVSRSVARNAHRVFGRNLPVRTVMNAVDLNRFTPQDSRASRAEERRAVRVGLSAGFARWKGHQVFLRALSHPCLQRLNVRGYVIGGPIYQTRNSQFSFGELRALASHLGVTDRVEFTGFISDTASAVRALDIAVHASTEPEPFGLSIAEAMACGKAVIAAKSGGACELFSDGVEGIAVKPGDPQALAHAIAELAADEPRRRALGRAARQAAEMRFDRARLGPELVRFYRQVAPECESSTYTAEISTAA